MFDVRACRGCLATKGHLEKLNNMYKKIYTAVTGIQVNSLDGLPGYLCPECQSSIRKALVFRRRCRRAYYVMKEIMTVRKQVTLNDIMTVSRKKTNLTSPYSYAKLHSNTYFMIAKTQPDIDTLIATLDKYEPEDTSTELVKQDISNRSTIFHLDIPPDIVTDKPIDMIKEIEPADEILGDVEIDTDLIEDKNDDIVEFDQDKEEIDDEEDDVKEEFKFEVEEKSKKGKNRQARDISEILINCDIRVMSDKEQRDMFKEMLQTPSFRLAVYKCALCVVIMVNLDELLEHVEMHNKGISYPFICDVCKIKFETQDELVIHNAVTHLYEYSCKKCDHKSYTLAKIIAHHKEEHTKKEIKMRLEKIESLKENFKILPCVQELMYFKRSHPMSKHRCYICDMKFFNINMLNAHIKKHTRPSSQNVYQCDICSVYYKNPYTIARHIQLWHANSYQCRRCKEIFFNGEEAQYHFDHKHGSVKYRCEICDKKLWTVMAMKHHKVKMHYSQTYKHHCNLCGESYCSQKSLYHHQIAVHKYISVNYNWQGNDEFHCAPCETTFLSLSSYQNHALIHGHEIAKTFENACLSCKKVFPSAEEYQTHLDVSCKELLKFPRKCPYCDLIMSSSLKYIRHHKVEHSDMPLMNIRELKLCDLCGMSVVDLACHRRSEHNSVRQEIHARTCPLCCPPRALRGATRYVSHVVRTHTPRPYLCALCTNSYRALPDCKDHILLEHAPETPYNCDQCPQAFSHGSLLKEHAKLAHDAVVSMPRSEAKGNLKLRVYPHMKINMSLVDPSALAWITIEKWDYLNQKVEILEDFSDYIVLDAAELTANNKPKRKRRKRKKLEVVEENEVVEYVEDYQLVEQDGEQYINIDGVLYKVEQDLNI